MKLERQEALPSLDAFAAWLAAPGAWLGGFDLPFGRQDIADLLGYSSLGAFTRWYRQTFGRPPSRARKAAAAVPTAPTWLGSS